MSINLKRNLLQAGLLAWTLVTSHVTAAAEPALSASGQAQSTPVPAEPATETTWANVQTRFISAGGVDFAYRELGSQNRGTPVVFLNHLAAVLDNWDPRVVDGIAAKHRVIVFDNRGVGASSGTVPESIEGMADDAITFIKALGLDQVDLLGFSMGGMISQEIVLKEPRLIRKMILAGTGPAGGVGISEVAGVANYDLMRALLTFQDPKQFLFFTRTPNGVASGKAFVARLHERTENRDKEIAISAYIAQLRALDAWGRKPPADLSVVKQAVFVANGDQDRMIPSVNSQDLARRLPNSTLVLYPDAGHGGIFQYHDQFVPQALDFLAR